MNREEIHNMPAGREMDEMIWIGVFGRAVVALGDAPCPYCGSEMRFCGKRSWCSECREWRFSSVKEYSTDISAAWEVAEKLQKKRPFVLCSSMGGYMCNFDLEALAHAPTAPLAICRAALLAKTGEE